MRTKKSFFNIIANVSVLLLQTFLTFFVRVIFVKNLSEQYLGLQGLFTNIIAILSLAELGIASAISYSLYEPLANQNYEKINAILSLLRKMYTFFGLIIIIIGFICCPFISFLITGYNGINVIPIFIIYIITLAMEYFIIYPEILIVADQKKYKLSKFYISTTILSGLGQIIVLNITKNFIYYILVESLSKIIRFLCINFYVKKHYSKINFYSKNKINRKEKNCLVNNIRSLFLLKIGDSLINSTDNILISKLINISMVGIYNNYLSIITILKNVVAMAMSGITSSYGDLLIINNNSKRNVFNIINFITFVFAGLMFLGLVFVFNDFILLIFGEKYLLNQFNVILICINLYICILLLPVEMVKNAAGIYSQDKYITIFQAICNIILSIILAKIMGFKGIIIGSTISYILFTLWERPFIVYKEIFNDKVSEYFKIYIKNIFFVLIIYFIIHIIFNFIPKTSLILTFIIKSFIILVVYTLATLLTFRKKTEFIYIKNLIRRER